MSETGGTRVLVIGGGIAGLAAAWHLARADLRVALVEATERLGGAIGTETDGGFIFERGPNGFLERGGDETLALAAALGLEGQLITASERAVHRYIVRQGRLVALPRSPLEFLTSRVLSMRGRLRVLTEPFRARGSACDESVGDFGRRRVGREAVEMLLDPLVTGVFGGDVDKVSVRSAFPRIAELEARHGSLFRGMRASRRERQTTGAEKPDRSAGPAGRGGALRSFRRGLGSLIDGLASALGDAVSLGCEVESLARLGGGRWSARFAGDRDSATYDAVVIASPAPVAATLLCATDPSLASEIDAIPHAPIAVVCLGLDRDAVSHPLDGYGFLVPRKEGIRCLGMIWTSTLFPDHAPRGKISLRAMVGGARDPGAASESPSELEGRVVRELGPLIGLRAPPVSTRVFRYSLGLPQYHVGHAARLEAIAARLAESPGIYLTGNAYRGVGINDLTRDARAIAESVARDLDQRR